MRKPQPFLLEDFTTVHNGIKTLYNNKKPRALCECVFLFVLSESEGDRSQETVLEKMKERKKES